jgi:hypothetical protein
MKKKHDLSVDIHAILYEEFYCDEHKSHKYPVIEPTTKKMPTPTFDPISTGPL